MQDDAEKLFAASRAQSYSAGVQELLNKIKEAARSRLAFGAGATSAEKLARYKHFLKVETHRLKLLHRAGAGGLEICRARAAILDALIRHLWESARSTLSAQAQKEFPQITLVATGGFGRGELNPHSDIDFMFLHKGQVAAGKPLPHLATLLDGVLYPLWDIGLKVGHSVRDLEDCVKVANTDMQSKTSLIESRFIAGDEALFVKFQKTVAAKCIAGHEAEYIAARLEDQTSRRTKHGNSACMQEPNVKSGCGGLRDFQNLLWMALFKYKTRSLDDLKALEFMTESERRQLVAAHDFLLRVRTEMHYHANRAQDVLGKNLQPAVALNLGYGDRSPSRRIEKFMRDLYVQMRNILLITRTLEQRMALLPAEQGKLARFRSFLPGGRTQKLPESVDGFIFADGEIRAASNRIFRDSPRRLMRVFLHAQHRGLRLHPDLAQLIRSQISLVDRAFLNDERVSKTFLAILDRRGDVSRILRAMHEVNLLGKYIPEFGRLTCLVQHEFYHQYAADEHTLVCLEQLDRIRDAKDAPFAAYGLIFQGLERPGLLYLALLLHDVGKGAQDGRRGHADAGAALVMRIARRLKLDAAAAATVKFLVENHLLMAGISQRRDMDDASLIRNFARQVGTVEHLNLLTLLTFADSQGTSDKLWNSFKDSLLWQLHTRTMLQFNGGTEFRRASEMAREQLCAQVRELGARRVSQEELNAHLELMPQRYFEIHTAPQIVEDIALMHHFMRRVAQEEGDALAPLTSWVDEESRGYSLVKICTWDRAGLFGKIAGSLSASGLNILGAQIFTRADGIVLDAFSVNDSRTGMPASREQHEKFDALLTRGLTGDGVDFPALIQRQASTRPPQPLHHGDRLATQIRFDNEASDDRTLIEIEAEDRIGLLYTISQTLAELRLDIYAARVVTERGAAVDSFYVSDADGVKIVGKERREHIAGRLLEAIGAV